MQLEPCRGCRRHIAATAACCPFCGVDHTPLRARIAAQSGRFSRAAVFAGLAACYTSTPATHTPPPPPDGTGSAFAQPPPDPVPAPGTGAIRGAVRNGQSHRLLANTTVMLRSIESGIQSTVTDQHGYYTFEALQPGQYSVYLVGNGNPRQQPTMSFANVTDGGVAHVDLETETYVSVPDRGPCCKPYGAPPARRRIV